MAIDAAALSDLRQFVKRRMGFMMYRENGTKKRAEISDAQVLSNGIVRIKATITPVQNSRIDRIELYNNNSDLWAHQDVDIRITYGQTGVLYWFDFTIKEDINNV